jgi:hypothetical protein
MCHLHGPDENDVCGSPERSFPEPNVPIEDDSQVGRVRISLEVFTFSVASFENDRDGGIFASRK